LKKQGHDEAGPAMPEFFQKNTRGDWFLASRYSSQAIAMKNPEIKRRNKK
jgi:hypothetical protein